MCSNKKDPPGWRQTKKRTWLMLSVFVTDRPEEKGDRVSDRPRCPDGPRQEEPIGVSAGCRYGARGTQPDHLLQQQGLSGKNLNFWLVIAF